MSQEFNKVSLTDKINSSLSVLLRRDETSLTLSAGEQEPQDIEVGMEGRLCLRTDLKVLKVLTSVEPVVWETIIDFGADNATKQWVEENFQALNKNLTALSNVSGGENKVPYFDSQNSMSTFDITAFGSEILNSENAEAIVEMLGLKVLATIDKINSSNVDSTIADNAITKEKLAFEPITSEQGYTTGDIKETYNENEEEGWIRLYNGETTKVTREEVTWACYYGTSLGSGYLYVKTPVEKQNSCYYNKDNGGQIASSADELTLFSDTISGITEKKFEINTGSYGIWVYDRYEDGDIKENVTVEIPDYISIGNTNSGATYKGQDYNDLFTKIWNSSAVSFQDSTGNSVSRGASANADWNSNRRLMLPSTFKGINPNCCYKIKM